jgi:hypothetical protein
VGIYYRYSPPVADYIAERPAARAAARAALLPLVYGARHPLGLPALAACAAVIVLYRVGSRKRRRNRK